jgi:ubiquinone/menaquinone biosynthesis C-methylase UbiE
VTDRIDDSEYRGLAASAWDLLRGDTSRWPDRAFYREVIEQSGEPVLDVGCATGRLLLDYAGAGIKIDGVDASPEMLTRCREKAVAAGVAAPELHRQTLQSLDLPGCYATILVSSSTFQLLTGKGEPEEALRRLLAHLTPGGTLVMSLMEVWRDGQPLQLSRLAAEATRPEDGALIRHTEVTDFDPGQRLARTQNLYEIVREGRREGSERHDDVLRWYDQEEIQSLLQTAGFREVRIVRGFTQEPAGPEDRVFCVLGTRTSDG